MKRIFALSLLLLLIACAPKEPVQPVIEQAPVGESSQAAPQPPAAPPGRPVVPPPAVPVQTITQPSETIDKIEIKSSGAVNVDIRDFSFQPALIFPEADLSLYLIRSD